MRKCHACEREFDHRISPCPFCGAVPQTLQKLQAENARLRARVAELEGENREQQTALEHDGSLFEKQRLEIDGLERAFAVTKDRITALEAELAEALAESRELLTIAHMDGYHRGSQGLKALIVNNTILRDRVVELKEELAEVNEYASQAVGMVCDFTHSDYRDFQDGMTTHQLTECLDEFLSGVEQQLEVRATRAEAERDEAMARCERLEKAVLQYCRAESHRDVHNADANLRAVVSSFLAKRTEAPA